jgi:hypothetical protein
MSCRLVTRLLLAAALMAGAATQAEAVTSQAFVTVPGGARAFAMAGAGVALTEDSNSTLLNPARLAYLHGFSANATYSRLTEDIPVDRVEVSAAIPIGSDISAPLQHDSKTHRAGVGIALEAMGLELSQGSRYAETQLTLAGAWAPSNFASLGVGGRVMLAGSGDVDGLSASGYGIDAGLSLALDPHIEGAIMARNLFGSVKYEESESSEDALRTVTFGLALHRTGWIYGEADLVLESEGAYRVQLGGEVMLLGLVSARAGLRQWLTHGNRTIFTAGAGVRIPLIQVDYGVEFDEDDALGMAHRVTVGTHY